MQHLMNRVSGLAVATAAMIIFPTQAIAQEDTAAAAAPSASGNIIVVTARGREENLDDVPLAISAFDEEDIGRLGLQGLDDVARFTPGFSFESFSGGFALPVIRGQAQSRVTALETNVSSFYDGIYIPRAWAVDVGTANLERIEIVKGPQSARYGRNAFAGAINYIPKKAEITGDIAGEIEGTVGSDDRYDIGAFLNFSVNEWFALAGSYNYSTFDGSWENAHPFNDLGLDKGTNGNIGGWENRSLTVSAIVEPAPGLTIEASYVNSDVKNEARASRYFSDNIGGILDPNDITATDRGLRAITNCGALRGPASARFFPLVCGDFPAPADTALVDPRSYGTFSNTGIFRFNAAYEISDAVTISYLFGNINGEVDIGTSGEPDPINCGTLVAGRCNFQVIPVGDIDYDSHEVRLAFKAGDSISGAIGGFYSTGVDRNTFTSVNLAPITSATNFISLSENNTAAQSDPANGILNILLANEQTETEVKALFGEFLWTSGDGMTRIGAEARYSETEITGTDIRRSITLSDTFKEFTPRITVERDLNSNVMLYASAARGAKAGGFNATARSVEDRTFDPEFNWTYEVGFKGDLANGRVNFNIAAYYTDWTDIQINSADFDPANPTNANVPSITKNLGNAELYGIEIAAKAFLTDALSIDATFSHTEGEYADGTFDSRFSRGSGSPFFGFPRPCDDVVCSADGDISGNKIERTTPTQASGGIQYDGTFGDNDFFARVDGSWQASFFGDSANLSVIPERFLMNAAAGITFNDTVSVRIWARNLLDKKYVSNAFAVLLPFGNTYGTFYGERRTIGLTAKVDF